MELAAPLDGLGDGTGGRYFTERGVVVAAMHRREVTLCILALSIKSCYSNTYLSITYIHKTPSKPPCFVYFQKTIIVPYLSMRFVFYLTPSEAVR